MSVRFMSARTLMLLLLTFGVLSLFIVSGVRSQKPASKSKERQKVTSIPPIISKVKLLEVVGSKMINEDSPAVGVSVEIKNNSYKAVMAVDLVCGDGAVTRNGLTDEENPIVVIEPYGTTSIEMAFAEMTYGAPLVISAVTYEDGTEEGDEKSLKIMHKMRAHDKARLKAERENKKGDPTP